MTESLHFMSGAYALDALDDIERARFEAHLSSCDDCRDEVASLQLAAADLGSTAATAPPAALRAEVLAAIATVRPLPPVISQLESVRGGRHRTDAPAGRDSARWRLTAMAAAVLAIACLSWAVVSQRGLSTSEHQRDVAVQQAQKIKTSAADAQTIQSLLTASDVNVAESTSSGGVKSLVFRSKEQGTAALMLLNLPEPGPDKVFQAWVLDEQHHPAPAGVIGVSSGRAMHLLSGDVTTATQVAITVEPTGGSDQPSSAPVAQLDLT